MSNVADSYFNQFIKKPLIVLDVANNHSGSVEHGKRIIDEVYLAAEKFDFKIAIKFQYRDLDSFIHKKYKSSVDYPMISRFQSTALNEDQFLELKQHIDNYDFITSCTPFDEASVDKVMEHNYDIVKIASASISDWPLLEYITERVDNRKPIIASTAGINLSNLDRITQFLSKRVDSLAIMHCVAKYPTKNEDLHLNRITEMMKRYSNLSIGYSTHEDPKNLSASLIALGKGATVFERHVGKTSEKNELNKYSSEPFELEIWLKNLSHAIEMLGDRDYFKELDAEEQKTLRSLKRGVYVKKKISKKQTLKKEDLYFAIPLIDDQLASEDIAKHVLITSKSNLNTDVPLKNCDIEKSHGQQQVIEIAEKVHQLYLKSGITLPTQGTLEISHHYGLSNYSQFGASFVTMVNRNYCKKLISIFKNQTHPEHFHKIKDETFICVYGVVDVKVAGVVYTITPGQTISISPGVKHSFTGITDAVLEEISTKHLLDDSFYTDSTIAENDARKTTISLWFND